MKTKVDEANIDVQAARGIINELKTFATAEDLRRVAAFISDLRATAYAQGKSDGINAVLK